MVKKRNIIVNKETLKKIQTRNQKRSRKISEQDSKEKQTHEVLSSKSQIPQKELQSHEIKKKFHHPTNHEDIDIYFASCISQTHVNRVNNGQQNEKNSENFSNLHFEKQIESHLIKQEYADAKEEFQRHSFQEIQEENSQNQNQDSQYGNQYNIFSRRNLKNETFTPSNKLEEFKVYENSEEIIRRDLMDQLQQGSKPSFQSEKQSGFHQIANQDQVRRSGKNNKKKSKKGKSWKNKTPSTYLPLQETQLKLNSGIHYETVSEIRRKASMLRLSCLEDNKRSYEYSLEALRKTSNILKNVMYYYQIREQQEKVYSFRSNVFQVINEQIKKFKNTLQLRRQVCFEAIQKKLKSSSHFTWECQEKRALF